jgi:putative ABC transport system permease protein
MIGLALVSGVSVIVASAQQSLSDLVDRTFIGDLLITRDNRLFSPNIAAEVAKVPGVGLVVQQTAGPAESNGRPVEVNGLGLVGDTSALETLLNGASPDDLIAGRAVLGQSAATDLGLGVGDTLPLLLPSGGTMAPTIAAVVEDNPLLGGIVLPISEYRAAGGEPDDRAVFVAFDGSVPRAEVDAAVREVVAVNPLLDVLSQTELKERNQQALDQLLYLVVAMLGLSIVIAALGVVNTMALSVVERTREIGLLRAVGASRRQVRRMIRWEAVLVSLLGGVLGVAIGVLVGAALQQALAGDGLESLAIPWTNLAWIFLAAVLIGVIGAILPARRASRMDILQSIATE